MTHITDRLFQKKWGVFNHYLAVKAEEAGTSWNEAVNSIDVKKIGEQLTDMGAGYYFITLCQGSRYMLTPNETYDKITGAKPGEACSDRDIVSELYEELSKRNIDLYLYFPSDGPHADKEFGKKMGFAYDTDEVWDIEAGVLRPEHENKVLAEKRLSDRFISNWSSVLKEYADRYGDKVCGWWLDGYYSFFGYNNQKMKPFYDAIKNANPNAVVAFNSGVHETTLKWYENEDFTAGEFNNLEYIPPERFTHDGAQNHILAPLGTSWGKKDAVHDNEYVKNYIKAVNANGGVVTVDIGINYDGSYSEEQMKVMKLKDIK